MSPDSSNPDDTDGHSSREAPRIPQYNLHRRIGDGSYGEVWLAKSIAGDPCAIKIVYRDQFSDATPYHQEFQGIRNTVEISRATGPLVTILHVGQDLEAGFFYYAMELADSVNGDDLQDYEPMTAQHYLGGNPSVPVKHVIDIGLTVLTGLGHLHLEGYVHKDIKPSNIIFIDGRAKIADVGLVGTADPDAFLVGTEGYAPDQQPCTVGADLYALGKVLYELLTGFDRLDFPKWPAGVSENEDLKTWQGLNTILERACSPDPKQRYRSAREMFDDLIHWSEQPNRKPPAEQWWDSIWEDSGPPEPNEQTQLEAASGAVPLDSRLYVARQADLELETAIDRCDTIILLKGARQMGKTSLLARGMHQARQSGARVVLSDLQSLSGADMANAEAFYRALAEDLAEQLDLPSDLTKDWSAQRSPNKNFERFLRRDALASASSPLFWAWDEVDRLFGVSFGTEVFSLLRACYNKQALEPEGPWERFSLAMAYASETQLFIQDINQSPFNVGTRIRLRDFDLQQVRELNGRHGKPLASDADLEGFFIFFGSQPYLSRQGFYELVTEGHTFDELCRKSNEDGGPFEQHLNQLLQRVRNAKDLLPSVMELLKSGHCSDTTHFYRLSSLGLLKGRTQQDAGIRCQLYHRFLERRLL